MVSSIFLPSFSFTTHRLRRTTPSYFPLQYYHLKLGKGIVPDLTYRVPRRSGWFAHPPLSLRLSLLHVPWTQQLAPFRQVLVDPHTTSFRLSVGPLRTHSPWLLFLWPELSGLPELITTCTLPHSQPSASSGKAQAQSLIISIAADSVSAGDEKPAFLLRFGSLRRNWLGGKV